MRRHILLREISTTEKKKNREPANVWGRDTGEGANVSIVKMNFHEANKQCRRGNSRCSVFFLPLAALKGAKVRGMMAVHHSRKDRFALFMNALAASVYEEVEVVYYIMMPPTTKTECKCKSEIAYVVPPVSSFFR